MKNKVWTVVVEHPWGDGTIDCVSDSADGAKVIAQNFLNSDAGWKDSKIIECGERE